VSAYVGEGINRWPAAYAAFLRRLPAHMASVARKEAPSVLSSDFYACPVYRIMSSGTSAIFA
jgi:hypothetical protein